MKKLHDLSIEEIKTFLEKNEEIGNDAASAMIDCVADYLEDILQCFPRGSIKYEFGVATCPYFEVCDNENFIRGLKNAIEQYGVLNEKYAMRKIEKYNEYSHKVDAHTESQNCFEYCSPRFYQYEKWIEIARQHAEDIIEELASDFENFANSFYENYFNHDAVAEFFKESYIRRFDEDTMIDENYELI